MATWLIDVVKAGAEIYGAATANSGGGQVGRGGDSAPSGPTVGTPAPTGMFDTPGMAMTVPAAGMLGPLVGGAMGGIRGMVPRVATALGMLSRSAAGKRLLALTKTVGIQAAAAALGIGLAEALGLLGEQVGKRRRSRGISSRDLRTTRRTTRRLLRAAQDLSALGKCVTTRRRSPC